MKTERKAVTSTVFAIGVVVALIVAGVAGYYAGTASPTSAQTVTQTVTASGGGGGSSGSLGNAAQQYAVLAQDAVAAQKECASQSTCLTIYTTVDTSDWQAEIAPNFYQNFPWANGKVNWDGLTAAQVTSMAISEHQTGNVVGDILDATSGIIYPALLAGAIQNYSSPIAPLANLTTANGGADAHGAFYVSIYSIPCIQYNPNQLKALNLPTPAQWSDLGNPAYKGQIGFQTAASLSATTGIFYYLYNQMGNQSWTTLMRSIAANSPVITPSASATTDNIASGKVAIGIGLYNDYLSAHESSPTTIGTVCPNPQVYNPGLIAMTQGTKHPAMAKLMIDWILSNGGMTALAETARSPFNPAIDQIFNLLPPGVTSSGLHNSYTNPALFKNPGAWSATFKNIFGA